MKRLLPIVLLAAGCAKATPPAEAWVFDQHLGLASVKQDAACVSAAAGVFAPGERVELINPADQSSVAGVVDAPPAPCEASVSDVPLTVARVKLAVADVVPFAAGIAVDVRPGTKFDIVEGAVVADLDGDGTREYFRSCFSAEGVHLTVWSGAPLTGQRRWHAYYYVGYDMTPNCTSAEVGGQ